MTTEYSRFEPYLPDSVVELHHRALGAMGFGQQQPPFVTPAPMPEFMYSGYSLEADRLAHESLREGVAAVRPILLAELEHASAPLTGKTTACVLTTWSGKTYSGHTEERGIGQLTTATMMALQKLDEIEPSDEKLAGIYYMGKNLRKPKHVMPTPGDYDTLSRRFMSDWGPTIIIASPDSEDYESVWASVHRPAYGVKEPSDFRELIWSDEDLTIIPSLIAKKTGLDNRDACYVAHLMHTGIEAGIEIYLVGSASGRGEISNALKPRREAYSDIDLLVVCPTMNPAEVEELMIERAEYHYGPMREEQMLAHDWKTGREYPGIFLFSNEGKKLQLHIGQTMEEVNFRPSNIERNFYHRVA
jgi:hypothetical protein